MPLTHRSIRDPGPLSLDHELEALQHAVSQSRQNRWHGGDVIGSELQGLLAVLISPPGPMTYGAELEPSPLWRKQTNTWREDIHEVDRDR